jgi:hypothetical protein
MCSLSESSQSKCPLASPFSKCLDRKLPSKDDPVCTAIFWLGLYVSLDIPLAISFLIFYFIVAIAVEFPP